MTARELMQEAEKARKHSYSPYSRFPVGAALLTSDGEVIHGTNVENASFGLSVCADRRVSSRMPVLSLTTTQLGSGATYG